MSSRDQKKIVCRLTHINARLMFQNKSQIKANTLTSSSSVSTSERGQSLLLVKVLDTKDLSLDLVERQSKGGSSRGNVLEGRSGRKDVLEVGGSSGELLDEGVGVESVEVVDVTRGTRED